MKIVGFLLSTPFAFAAVYHLLTLVIPGFGEPASVTSHLIFIGINTTMTLLHILRPRWFFAAACLLILQQLYSHTVYGLMVWNEQQRIDWYSVIVVLGFPFYLLFYWRWYLPRLKR